MSRPTAQTGSLGRRCAKARPNLPKPGELSTDTLTAPVPLAGVRTVRDLVIRIGLAQHLELYADARYAARTVILAGAKSAPAGDLLSALALCVSGAYRKVGPAYVLTDDLVRLGRQKHVLWKDFETKAAALLPAAASSRPR